MENIRVQLLTNCGIVLIVTTPSLYFAIKDAEDNGYKVVSAVQLAYTP